MLSGFSNVIRFKETFNVSLPDFYHVTKGKQKSLNIRYLLWPVQESV